MAYKVELRKGFPGERRNRAEVSVTRTEPYEGDLTNEQIAAIKADPELVLSEAKGEKVPAKKAAKPKAK